MLSMPSSLAVFMIPDIRVMTRPILYYSSVSPPARFALWTAKYLNVGVVIKHIDLFRGEQNNPDYIKINPKRTVPSLLHDKIQICDSHAISSYLCDTFNRNSSLYPIDPRKRALIDQMLYFNSGVLFPLDSIVMSTHFAHGSQCSDNLVPYEHLFSNSLDILEVNLKKQPWLAGEKVTLADLCCVTTINTLHLLLPISDKKQLINDWRERCQKLPHYDEVNLKGIIELQRMLNEFRIVK